MVPLTPHATSARELRVLAQVLLSYVRHFMALQARRSRKLDGHFSVLATSSINGPPVPFIDDLSSMTTPALS